MSYFVNDFENARYLRGDIYYIKGLGCSADAGLPTDRPGIIVSNDTANRHSPNVTVAPLTTRAKKPLPTHVEVLCTLQSTAMCESIQTVSKSRIGNYIKHCTNEELTEMDTAICCALGLSN